MKKAVSLFLALALMVASLAGCGSNSGGSNNDGEAVFKIGGIGPESGGTSIYGNAVKNGAQIAVDEINANGGINGVKIAYKFEDDEGNAEKAVNAYNTLKDWGVQMLMGAVTSDPCIAVAAKTVQDGMLQITPSGSSMKCVATGNVYQVCFTDPNQGIKSAQYVGENKLAEKVFVIYNTSDSYSSGIAEAFIKEADNQPFEIVAPQAGKFTDDTNTDFKVQLQKAKDAGADMVFLPIYYQEAALILRQADDMGYEPTFCGGDGLDGLLSVDSFDTSLAEGIILLTPFIADAEDERTQNFVKTYKEKYGDVPNQFAADAYDAIYIFKEAIEEAGVTADMSAKEIGTKLQEVMTKIKVTGLTGVDMTWSEDGTVNKDPHAVKIVDGKYQAM